MTAPDKPDLVALSLGAGVQSTTLALLAVEGVLPKPDVAIFADTGWEPRAVYEHLDRLTAALTDAGIRVDVVQRGNLRADVLDPNKPTRLPAFVRNPDGTQGMQGRSCTDKYKLRPIRERVRELLGAAKADATECPQCEGSGERVAPWRARRGDLTPGPCSVCDGAGILERVGLPPAGRVAEMWIGFSTDEIQRVNNRGPAYIVNRHPLLELGMSRVQCLDWLDRRGWATTPKSACIGCPFHGNAMWRGIRDTDPEAWADAVAFDEEFRRDPGLDGELFLHRSLLPLASAPIDRIERKEYEQGDLFDAIASARFDLDEFGDPDGCSPYGCRSGLPVDAIEEAS